MGSLITHEISLENLRLDEEKEENKTSKQGIALKSQVDESEPKNDKENNIAFIEKQIGIYFQKKDEEQTRTTKIFKRRQIQKQSSMLQLQQAKTLSK